jgi:hypothetical protein
MCYMSDDEQIEVRAGLSLPALSDRKIDASNRSSKTSMRGGARELSASFNRQPGMVVEIGAIG